MITHIQKLGTIYRFGMMAALSFPKCWRDWRELIRQLYYVGVLSLPIVILSALTLGFVLNLLSYAALIYINSQEAVGRYIANGILREMAPVVGGLVFIGRAASSITAELGLMKVSDQITSLEMIGVDVWRYVYFPRFWAMIISFPLLVAVFAYTGLLGAYFYSTINLHLDAGYYWSVMTEFVYFSFDLLMMFIKGLTFPIVIATYALYFGVHVRPTPISLSLASTKTVVVSAGTIFLLDYIVTAIITGVWLP